MHNRSRHSSLPDVAADAPALARPLDWVGMDAMALPIRLPGEHGQALHVPAQVDVAVDLGDAAARGIHMSRLYLQLQESLANEALSAPALRKLLESCIASQQGLSSRARLRLRYDHLLLRPALASGNSGWKNYPVALEAELRDGHLQLSLAFSVEYSSTCPASAALSRQVNAQRFATDFAGVRPLSNDAVRDWLASERGLAATPHAQRSRAELRVELKPAFDELPLKALVDAVEAALGTPVQTAVKREDEQAFAELNAANLMFCEDAARRVAAALAADPRVSAWQVRVAHFESLHPHDAVASVSGRNA
ncbi:MAG: GTP cyclohydrolase I FolE2 [Thermomonas sp.]|uniref:GTP cyclohydrolase FolE2 n=1 Tax=Thermomonas sp. TaxID=1971895 RepID=UPI001B718B21|nr:GTP cyclohydrolase FolE2 [Thermomonas sp.]MBK6417177.1 GTP cyclohydrolase I FolE2 [Thermomonas sp.]MBP7157477.1 GTP cyclohydrolase I FolE2 [Thermomonas sp.]MBP7787690.1 GTP cyclohydrolase I FolE2 [Thermomonas sp.]MBP8615047.1 GTP cyclohydrolase I FolE2 [Thermomonas sp.]MBP8647247.1 GTP cyclohydrolase I FolE2 [Thermomonas sp.]